MMDKVKQLLILLQSSVPPCNGCRHNITINDDVNLEITLMTGDKYYPIVLFDDDLQLSVEELLTEILRVHKAAV